MDSVYILKTFWVEETETIHLFTHSFIYAFTQHLLSSEMEEALRLIPDCDIEENEVFAPPGWGVALI